MAETGRSPAQPAVVLGLTFLLIGLTFALPFRLLPETVLREASPNWSMEVGNVYAVTAWAGWAHFIYAFRGQGGALSRMKDGYRNGRLALLVVVILASALILGGIRAAVGVSVFGGVVWVYFIDHFLKAELSFEGKDIRNRRWLSSYQPLITFGWLSIVLLDVGGVTAYPWLLWGVSLAIAAGVLIFDGWKNLAAGDVRSPLISLFFVAEALVWGTISRFGESVFLSGVYVFHIAAGSYFHYLGSYFYAQSKAQGRDKLLTPLSILAINLLVIGLGFAVATTRELAWFAPVLGVPWFTLWVAVHLVVSDAFPLVKQLKRA